MIETIRNTIKDKSPEEALDLIAETLPGQVVFSSSLGLEDQVITYFIFKNNLAIDVFTIDSGRLFPETIQLLETTCTHYKKSIKVVHPNSITTEKLVLEKGAFSFYDSVDGRKECCNIRKVEPLKRALQGNKIWVTGIRAEQSLNRQTMQSLEWDENNQIIKFHPLLQWTFEDVKNYVRSQNIPYNPLHDKGFVSIGCSPCTRAIKEGEDFRAGRWWWENNDKKECGLHS